MKEEILKRAMFAMPLSKEAQGTGIMSGFDMEEMDSMDEDVDENADMEQMPPMARTPQNPEILMNTLRGDMRSLAGHLAVVNRYGTRLHMREQFQRDHAFQGVLVGAFYLRLEHLLTYDQHR